MILLDGKIASQNICNQLRLKVQNLKNNPPHLVIFLVGNKTESAIYVKSKIKRCHEIGITPELIHLPDNVSQHELIERILFKAADKNIHGIMVQLPLPSHLHENTIIANIPPQKDVDGMHYENLGKICFNSPDAIIPATPLGILLLLKHYNIPTESKHVVILGRSQIVGKPLSILLSNPSPQGNATISLCHSKTKNIQQITQQADIIIAAIGKPLFLKKDMVKPGVSIIDVGINQVPNPNNPKGYDIVGDVDFHNIAPLCNAITPVPGGVGPMTIAALMHNIIHAYTSQTSPSTLQ